jgi:hypothetical protein
VKLPGGVRANGLPASGLSLKLITCRRVRNVLVFRGESCTPSGSAYDDMQWNGSPQIQEVGGWKC